MRRRKDGPNRRRKKLLYLIEEQHKVLKPCTICGGYFAIEELPDNEYMGRPYCAWCATRNAIRQIQLMVIAEKLAERGCKRKRYDYKYLSNDDCGKCLECVAKKVMPLPEPEVLQDRIDATIRGESLI